MTVTPSAAVSERLEALQGLRAIAAGLVVFSHALNTYSERVDAGAVPEARLALGELGVKIFFCISGYIICVAGMKLLEGTRADVSYFLRRRLIRIVPIYWIATTVYAGKLILEGDAPSWGDYVLSLFFVPYANDEGLMRPVLGQGWTLNFEMVFYLLFAACLFLRGIGRYVVLTVALGALVAARPLGVVSESDHLVPNALYLLTEPYLLYFLGGIWLAIGFGWLRDRPVTAPAPSAPRLSVLLVAILAVLGVFVSTAEAGLLPSANEVFVDLWICLLLVAIGAVPARAGSWTSRSADSSFRAILVGAGDGSYSTYLTHGFLVGPAGRVLAATGMTMPPVAFAVGSLIVCTAAGWTVYRLVEKPILTSLNDRWGRRSKIEVHPLV